MALLALGILALWRLAAGHAHGPSDVARFLTIVGLPMAAMLLLAWLFGGARRRTGRRRRLSGGAGQTLVLP